MSFEEIYQEIILEHYRNPRNKRADMKGSISVKHINHLCGDTLTLNLDKEENRIKEISYDCQCCSICQASASMMTEKVKGRTLDEADAFFRKMLLMMHGESVGDELGDLEALKGVAKLPVRVKCALLPWMALKEAISKIQDQPPPQSS